MFNRRGLRLGRGLGVSRSCRGNGLLCWGWALSVRGTGCAGHWVSAGHWVYGICGPPGVPGAACAGHGVCVWLPGVPASTCARLWVANVPHRVSIVSEAGQGTLTIRDVKEADQGAYTCEAINTLGMVFGIPDSILTVTRPGERPLPPLCHQSQRGNVTIIRCLISHRAMSRGPLPGDRDIPLPALLLLWHHHLLPRHHPAPPPPPPAIQPPQ